MIFRIQIFAKAADVAIRSQNPELIHTFTKLAIRLNLIQRVDTINDLFWHLVVVEASRRTKMREKRGTLHSLWGVTPIVTISQCAKADRQCGVRSDSLVFSTYHTAGQFTINLSKAEIFFFDQSYELFLAFRRMVLTWALLNYDIFHLYNDRGILEPSGGYGSERFGIALPELKLYQSAGKKLFTYAYGADHRLRKRTLSLAPLNFCMDCPEPGKYCVCDDEAGETMLATIKQYSTEMIGFGLSMDLLPQARWMNYLIVDQARFRPSSRKVGQTFRIGHFPNHGFFKGTRYLDEAVAKLKDSGLSVELVRLSGVSNDTVLAAMADVDVVVDQLISGCFGLTAVEAMALGRPVICHLRKNVMIAAPDECPIIRADPTTIYDVLLRLMHCREELDEAGRRGIKYVARYCSDVSLAMELADLYEKTFHPGSAFTRNLRLWRRLIRCEAEQRGGIAASSNLTFIYRTARAAAYSTDKLARFLFWRGFSLAPYNVAHNLARCLVCAPARAKSYVSHCVARARNVKNKVLYHCPFAPYNVAHNLARCLVCAPARAKSFVSHCVARARNVKNKVLYHCLSCAQNIIDKHDLLIDPWLEWQVAKARKATNKRFAAGQVKSLWGTTPILTLPLKAAADRKLGFQSKSIVFTTYHITKHFDINLEAMYRWISKKYPMFLLPFQKIVFGFCLTRFDIFNFFFDRGILPPNQRFGIARQELELLKRAGKRVYVYAYGADVRLRQKTLSQRRWTFCRECPEPGLHCVCDDEIGSKMIATITEFATATVGHGDMVAYLPKCRVLSYWPIDDRMILPETKVPSISGPLKVAHAPNHGHFKGTRHLEATIEKLREQGHDIEYVRVQGLPNSEVIELFRKVDVVADQFVGGGLGYTALEAMALAKPVLCYVPDPWFVAAPEECPVINANPDTLEVVLRWVLQNRERLLAIGVQGRNYIEKWHSVDAVAERFGKLYAETADLPDQILVRIATFRETIQGQRAAKPCVDNWKHPFTVFQNHNN
jgi:glycosyltransferase involved in cell wall biosynthesis